MGKCKQCEELKNKIDISRRENIKFALDTKKLIAYYSEELKRLRQILAEIKEVAEICEYKNILNVIERTNKNGN